MPCGNDLKFGTFIVFSATYLHHKSKTERLSGYGILFALFNLRKITVRINLGVIKLGNRIWEEGF